MTDDNNADLGWRNLVTQWHLDQGMPDCGCDDDTADDDFCQASKDWATERDAHRPAPELEGPPDKWNHDIWVAAWGHNATIVVSDRDFQIPNAPKAMSWLLTRHLVRGRKVIDLALVRLNKNNLVTLARGRSVPDQAAVSAKARQLLQSIDH